MQKCPKCQHQNRTGVVFCDNCGTSLVGFSPLTTNALVDAAPTAPATSDSAMPSVEQDSFKKGTVLRVEIEGAEPILIMPKAETVFGRRDPVAGTLPDVDLTPYAGYRMGVSRRHAVIRFGDENERLELCDLGSSNGTFLNGNRLSANRPYGVRHGDEIRFGQMIMRIFFQAADTLKAAAKPVGESVTSKLSMPSGMPNTEGTVSGLTSELGKNPNASNSSPSR